MGLFSVIVRTRGIELTMRASRLSSHANTKITEAEITVPRRRRAKGMVSKKVAISAGQTLERHGDAARASASDLAVTDCGVIRLTIFPETAIGT